MNRHGITKVTVTLVCDYGHETTWTQTPNDGGVGGGNAYCNGCDTDEHGFTWRGITWDTYDDSTNEVFA